MYEGEYGEAFAEDGFVFVRGALDPALAQEVRDFVDSTLAQSLERAESSDGTEGELFGATAPPDGGYEALSMGGGASIHVTQHRWNVLLPRTQIPRLVLKILCAVPSPKSSCRARRRARFWTAASVVFGRANAWCCAT